ncbi:MAG TPA: RluA family pseudouridine synthase [Actinomycetota bacterium]|nr:RluA family pseudouridine synthase [Actinomycetota bacterium]
MTSVDFVVEPREVGQRIDVVLARRAEVTRTRAQAALRNDEITVSGRPVRASYRLEEDDRVEGTVGPGEIAMPSAEDIPIEVRYQDDRVLVVSKPAGLVTHPARGHDSGTLVNALLGLGVDLAGRGSIRPGIVHRLDKETSGLLLVAKDDDAQASLVAAMKAREIARHYVALVRGRPPGATGTVDAPVGRHPTRRRLMSVVGTGRPAVTHYEVVEGTAELSLLRVRLETGRTHQIRVHMSHLGHPVLGDRVYGGVSELSRRLGLTRPFLHAVKLAFPHPDDGRPIEVADPLPPDLLAALDAAGLPPPAEW